MTKITQKINSKSVQEMADRVNYVDNVVWKAVYENTKAYHDAGQDLARQSLKTTPIWLKLRRLGVYLQYRKGNIKPLDALKFINSTGFYSSTARIGRTYCNAYEQHIYIASMWKSEIYDYAVMNNIDEVHINQELHSILSWVTSKEFENMVELMKLDNFKKFIDDKNMENGFPAGELSSIDFNTYYYQFRNYVYDQIKSNSNKYIKQFNDITPKAWSELTNG